MAFGLVDTSRKMLSDVVAYESAINDAVDYNYAVAPISRATDLTAETMGLVVIWDNVELSFRAFNDANATIVTTTRSSLPNGAELAVIVGTEVGKGYMPEDVTLGATDTNMTVMYRGEGALKLNGLVFEGTTSQANIDAARKALEVAGLAVQDAATNAATQYLG